MGDMLLRDYQPNCGLKVESHPVDRARFEVLDIHTHMGKMLLGEDYAAQYDTADFMERLAARNVTRICNMDGVWGEQFDAMLAKAVGFEDRIFHFVWIDHSRIEEPNFAKTVRRHIAESVKKGARGIKLWKDISLYSKDSRGKYLRTDDPRFKPVYEAAAEYKLPILIHIADPAVFFDPVDGRNERYEQLLANPDWSFCAPGYYSFSELMDMQDAMIEQNPDTVFIVAHLGSCAENLAHVSERLDRYPNMYVDTAARTDELGRQPYSARDFFLKYSDRILFGSDSCPHLYDEHKVAFRFLETRDEYFPYWDEGEPCDGGRWRIYGIYLPDDVLERVYHKNAERLLGL